MSAYLVRIAESHEILGFYVARDLVDLFWLIDECMDPCACEFKKIESGGFYWEPDRTPVLANLKSDDESNFDGVGPTEMMWLAMYDKDKGRWRSGDILFDRYAADIEAFGKRIRQEKNA